MSLSKIKEMYVKVRFSGILGLSKRTSMYEKIAAFLSEKNSLNDSLVKIRNRYAQRKDFRAHILSDWIRSVEQGSKFSTAINKWVPTNEMMLIEAGERGGSLPTGLKEASTVSKAAFATQTAIVSALAMPVFLCVLLALLLSLFQAKIAPIFKELLPLNRWPDIAKSLDTVSGFLYNNSILLIIVFAVVATVVMKTMGSWIRPPRHIFDRLPPWSLYRSYQASSFLIALSSLLHAGIPAFEALQIIERNASPWMKVHLGRMMGTMSLGGGNMGRALDTGLLDDETAGDVQDYSDLGSFTDTIYVIGAKAVEDGIKVIKSRMAVVQIMLLVFVTVSILWIYGASYALQSAITDYQGSGFSR